MHHLKLVALLPYFCYINGPVVCGDVDVAVRRQNLCVCCCGRNVKLKHLHSVHSGSTCRSCHELSTADVLADMSNTLFVTRIGVIWCNPRAVCCTALITLNDASYPSNCHAALCYTQRHGRSRANGDVENIIMMRLGVF